MPKILIIEDEAAIRRVLTKILSEENAIKLKMPKMVF
jgi:CheY-like chemotaxis protein